MIIDLPFKERSIITKIQEKNFSQTMDLCFSRHPYYRARFKQMGLLRGDIKSLADIHLLPVISKKDYAAEPEAFRLETKGLEEEATINWDVMHTTGTSGGRPTPFYSTSYDFFNTLTANRRALEIRQVRDTDSVANLCPMTLYPVVPRSIFIGPLVLMRSSRQFLERKQQYYGGSQALCGGC